MNPVGYRVWAATMVAHLEELHRVIGPLRDERSSATDDPPETPCAAAQ